MKRIPRFVLLLALIGVTPLAIAEESATDLATDRGLGDNPTVEETARQLAAQRGEAIDPKDTEESAEALADKMGAGISLSDSPESAQALAIQQGDAIAPVDTEESAATLATQQLGTPIGSAPAKTPVGNSVYSMPEGVTGSIQAIVVQTDGRVVIGGEFNQVGGQPRTNLARLNADGTLDDTFLAQPTQGITGTVEAIAIDSQGGILVGGTFNRANEIDVSNLVRFKPDGTLDAAFSETAGPNGKVLSIAVLASGDIVIGGEFSQVGDQERRNIAQLTATGQLAAAVTTSEITGSVAAIGVKPDGGVLAAGQFDSATGGKNLLQIAR